jgi:DNA primase
MKTINQSVISRIKEEVDMIDLASEYYELIPSGDLFKAKCKHGEDTPSLIFYPETQSFYCYGCHAGSKGSDVISFIQWMEDLSWQDAIIFLADKINIPIIEEEDENQELYNKKLELNRKYWMALKDDPNTLEWFYKKGLSDKDIERWRLGSSFGKPVYSIMDSPGRTVGFSYRNDNNPKYINDKNDEIFKKEIFYMD